MSQKKILKTAVVISMVFIWIISTYQSTNVYAASDYEFVVLNTYQRTLKIGDGFYLLAATSTGKKPVFSSDNSAVASVNTYGKVKAKKAGTAVITAKIKNGEASCKVKVKKTVIYLNMTSISLENGESIRLKASTSNGHTVTFRSGRSSIASVSEKGLVTAKKPGTTEITATADKTSVTCKVTVKKPSVKLSKSHISLYRKRKAKLSVTSSSKSTPTWKSNKKSVATVDENGIVTAIRHGTATITVTVDGCSKSCEVTVKQPKIEFAEEKKELFAGWDYQAVVRVSSKNKPEFSSSNTNVATVDENGLVHARTKGRAYIYAKEDGVKERMTITVTEQ